MMAHQAQALRLQLTAAQGGQELRQPFRPVHQAEAAAMSQEPGGGGAQFVERAQPFRPGDRFRFIRRLQAAAGGEIGRIGRNSVEAAGVQHTLQGAQIRPDDPKSILQSVDFNVSAGNIAGLFLDFHADDAAIRIGGAKKDSQRAAAAAEIDDRFAPQRGAEIRQQDRIRAYTKGAVLLQEFHPIGEQLKAFHNTTHNNTPVRCTGVLS